MTDNIPRYEKWMQDKHQAQMSMHEQRFGKLGELQTPKQKKALAKAIQEGK